MPKVSELRDILMDYHPDDTIAYSIWSKDDLIDIIERIKVREEDDDLNISLTDNQVEDIINSFHESHDAEYGLTWAGIEGFVDDVLRESKET